MRIVVENPSEARVEATTSELTMLANELTYTNTSNSYMLSKTVKNKWLRNNDPLEYDRRVKELRDNLKRTLIFYKNGTPYIRPGSIPWIKMKFDLVSLIDPLPEKIPMPWKKKPRFEPYSYQSQAVEKLISNRHAAIELCTGAGKSLILLMLSKTVNRKTVVVTPSKSIFHEIYDSFREHLGEGAVGCIGDGKKRLGKQVTVAIAKSLSMIKEGTPEWEEMQKVEHIAFDEAHTVPAATLEPVVNNLFKNAYYRFFVSGTQTRGDGSVKLLRSLTGPIVLSMNTKEGIENGYLCPVKFFIKSVNSKSKYKGSNILKLNQEHFLYNPEILDFTAKAASAYASQKGESSLILVEEIEQISELVKRMTVPVAFVHGNTTDSATLTKLGISKTDMQEEIERFNSGQVRVLIGTSCISTGTNFYPTHNVFNLQAGASEIGTKQGAIGRSVRKLEISKYKDLHPPKLFSKIWDFRVCDIKKMEDHLKKRIEFYEETGGPVKEI